MKPIRLVQIVGARPQFIKLAPISRAIAAHGNTAIEEIIIHTGQHYDPQLSDVFFDELRIPRPAANLEVGSGPHGKQTASMLERLEALLLERRPDVVAVYGDTNSTLAGVLAAVKLHIPTAHVEAGLRSHNRCMPEELNRVAADHLSDLLLAPTETAVRNLSREGLEGRTRLVGDVMYDAVLFNAAAARCASGVVDRLGLAPAGYGVVTVHRAESTQPRVLETVLRTLSRIADSLTPLVFPIHPRTRAAMEAYLPAWKPTARLRLIAPLGPIDMLRLTEAAAVVVTDSGGLQKEAFMLGCPCVTLRKETEWVETLEAGANTLVGDDGDAAVSAVERALATRAQVSQRAARMAHSLYGEGCAAARCVQEIVRLAAGRAGQS